LFVIVYNYTNDARIHEIKKKLNWQDWLTAGLTDVMLPAMLCIRKYMWSTFYLFFQFLTIFNI